MAPARVGLAKLESQMANAARFKLKDKIDRLGRESAYIVIGRLPALGPGHR
jgi:hypothetical protein